MAQEQAAATQVASNTPTLTHAERLHALLERRLQTTNKPPRFHIPSANVVFPEYYKAMVEERRCVYEQNEYIEAIIKRIGQWIEDSSAPSGLLLGGPPGNGKTTSIKALKLLIGLSGYRDPVNLDTYGHPEGACLYMVNAYDLSYTEFSIIPN